MFKTGFSQSQKPVWPPLLPWLYFIPLIAFTLEQAFVSSLSQSMRSQLNLQNLMLISEFELEQDPGFDA